MDRYELTPAQLIEQAAIIGIRAPKPSCKGAWTDRVLWALRCKERLAESDDLTPLFIAVEDANTCAVFA